MAESNNIIVPGYVQKVVYSDGIEYRNFSPDLVGNLPFNGDNSNTSLFTNGNFALTVNTTGKRDIIYPSKAFSKFYTLNELTPSAQNTQQQVSLAQLPLANSKIVLNLDNTILGNFAYFGSATEFVRVTLENIISKWPASLYFNFYDYQTSAPTPTILDYTYSSYLNTTTIKLNTNTLYNQFDIIYQQTGELLTNIDNPLKNFTVNYNKFNLLYEGNEYALINNIAPVDARNSYLTITVVGNPFNGMDISINNNAYKVLHIKPNNTEFETFFQKLDPFENNLLNRLTTPQYTSVFDYTITTDNGLIFESSKSLTWPTTDGYNIDFDTNEYVTYVTQLIDICNASDSIKSDLVFRFLTSESISNFDTIPRCDGSEEETAGQKMTKTLRVYGREFDEVKKFIDGISHSNIVSYDKKNNTPDQVVKYLAMTLGWQLTNSIVENDILAGYLDTAQPSYSGQSRGLTPVEAEIELWRRLVLNSAWLFKSKGTRKAVEFLFKFIGAPEGLISLNEYVYVAKEKLDIDFLIDTLISYDLATDLSFYPVDEDGYPKFFPDTPLMYFQKAGLWYKETGGLDATDFNLIGNNPHIGPYDGGTAYINQLRNIIPDFEPKSVTSTTYSYVTTELFTNYNNGIVNNYTGDTYVDIETWSGVSLYECFTYDAQIINDPKPSAEKTQCGCDIPADDLSLYINVVRDEYTFNEQLQDCSSRISGYTLVDITNDEFTIKPEVYLWDYFTYNPDGTTSSMVYTTPFVSKTCCTALVNGQSYLHDEYSVNEVTGQPLLVNSGYICCNLVATDSGKINGNVFKNFGFNSPQPRNRTPFGLMGGKPQNELPGGKTEFIEPIPFVNLKNKGCGCYLACQWRLAGPLLGQMYTLDSNKYLKFVTPKNNWGQNGTPEYRLVTEADGCMCPPQYTTPTLITDPYTNKQGFGCKINNYGYEVLNLNQSNPSYGTTNGALYQLFYQKSIGEIACTKMVAETNCNILLGNATLNLSGDGVITNSGPLVSNATEPYVYSWEITQQSGYFSGYGFDGGINDTSSIQVIKLTDNTEIRGKITIKVTITDAKGCKAYKTLTYEKSNV
jgi:hypothetical protein